jgi:hypothetical protein
MRGACNMGDGSLSAAIADFLSATPEQILACEEIAASVAGRLGFTPSAASISRILGQRTDWRRTHKCGRIAYERSV